MDSSSSHYRASGMSAVSTATTPMRPSTPDSNASIDGPFHNKNAVGSTPPPTRPPQDPFVDSYPASVTSSQVRQVPNKYFLSRRVPKADQPNGGRYIQKKNPKEKWVTIIPLVGMAIGAAIAGFLIYDGISSVVKNKYCQVLTEDFSGGFNTDIWTKEAEVGGYGNGQFEQTTTTEENVYVENGKLIIRPTLQDETLIDSNYVINLTADGTCTSTVLSNCVSITNKTTNEIIQPVKSGRINTKKGATIRYGKVEVKAKLPAGDWLWPAIWMLPVENYYGDWPLSGEIDIVESRGNNHTYAQGGNNIVSSALHWGPDSANDAWWKTNVKRSALHTTYAKTEHLYGLEWSQKYVFTYVDNVLLQVLYTNFDESLWKRGGFPEFTSNGSRLVDVWTQSGHNSAPFDREFYLIMNVAVGGTNGWFADGKSGKPWNDNSETAKYDFWQAREKWLPTWEAKGAGQMEVTSVKMWQQCNGNEND